MYKKQLRMFKLGYVINDNEDEAKDEKEITQIRHK